MARNQVPHNLHDFQHSADSFNAASPAVEMVDTRFAFILIPTDKQIFHQKNAHSWRD